MLTENKLKYSIGDKVVVKNGLDHYERYNGISCSREMADMGGMTLEITRVLSNCYEVKRMTWVWTDDMLKDSLTEEELIERSFWNEVNANA